MTHITQPFTPAADAYFEGRVPPKEVGRVADTKRVLRRIEATAADLDLVEMLLTSRSDAEAVMAYSLLRQTLDGPALVALANLREIIAEIPEVPFIAGAGLDALERVLDYESTRRSRRRLFESDHGVFGLEFVGEGTLCDGIVVHTASSRFYLHGDERTRIDHDMLEVIVYHAELLDAILEGLQTLGCPLEPRFYLGPDDFTAENAAAAASAALGELF